VAFFLLGAPISLLVGALTDSFNRRNLFVAVVLLGEGPCLATAFVRSYPQLFAMRALTGISVGGSLPLLYSLLGDMVPPSKRAAVSAGVGIAQGLGIAAGQIAAGYLGAQYGWRRPFVVIACPAILCALLTLVLVTEPRRGAQEPALRGRTTTGGGTASSLDDEYRERIDWHKARGIFRIRTNLLAFAQGIPGCIPWGVINTYLADFMAQDMHMGVSAATSLVAVFGAGSVVGSIAGGLGGQALYNVRARWLAVLMGATTAAGAVPMLILINMRRVSTATSLWAFLAGALSCVTGTNIRAVLIGVNAPETRGTCFALFGLFDSLGKGLGPAAVASLIGRLGRRAAFNQAMCLWLLCGALLLVIGGTVERDERELQQRLVEARAAIPSAEPQDNAAGDGDLVPLLHSDDDGTRGAVLPL
jgi:predicted MFS family arabinose efflux permease